MFDDRLELRVGEIALELRRINIHSIDGCVIISRATSCCSPRIRSRIL
jgi:hypothetical protein